MLLLEWLAILPLISPISVILPDTYLNGVFNHQVGICGLLQILEDGWILPSYCRFMELMKTFGIHIILTMSRWYLLSNHHRWYLWPRRIFSWVLNEANYNTDHVRRSYEFDHMSTPLSFICFLNSRFEVYWWYIKGKCPPTGMIRISWSESRFRINATQIISMCVLLRAATSKSMEKKKVVENNFLFGTKEKTFLFTRAVVKGVRNGGRRYKPKLPTILDHF